MTSCFVYKVIRDIESIDHLCINPNPQDRINTQVIYRLVLAQVKCIRSVSHSLKKGQGAGQKRGTFDA